MGAAATAAVTFTTPRAVMFAERVEVASPSVELGQVADLAGLPRALRDHAAKLVVVVLPPGDGQSRISRRDIAERACGLMPALRVWFANPPSGYVTLFPAAAAGERLTGPQPCLSVVRPAAYGAFPKAADFVPATCPQRPTIAFRYDAATGLARAARSLAVGDFAPMIPTKALAAIQPGEPVRLSVHVGVVTVDRDVEAVRPASIDGGLFVRAQDGGVFGASRQEIAR
jgi:hypothetical protein